MFSRSLLALATAGAFFAAPAQALSLTGVSGDAASVTDYSSVGLLSVDIDFDAVGAVTMSFAIDVADVAGMGVDFNAMLRNFTGVGLSAYQLSLDSGSFVAGSVTRQFGGATQVSVNGGTAVLRFDPLEYLDVEVGDPFGTSNPIDWQIDGLAAGTTLNLTVSAVPEPGTYALLLGGLSLVGLAARRRQRGAREAAV